MRPLRDLALEVAPGRPLALVGPSGSGKTTLLRVLAGLQVPDAGVVSLDGKPVQSLHEKGAVDARFAMVFQDLRLVDFLSVEENLCLAVEMRGVGVDNTLVSRCLDAVGLAGFESRRPRTLSGGEQQRVAIARALVLRCRVILADEPTGALDSENSRTVARLLVELAEQSDVITVVATHDPEVATLMAHRVRLRDGTLEPVSR
jgi:ABC-type lipoprotein export system ATPase subunit